MKWELLKKSICYKVVMAVLYFFMFDLNSSLQITVASFAAYFIFDWTWVQIFGWRKFSRGQIVWFTGIPCSGKTTISNAVAASLRRKGISVVQLDGDELRKTLCSGLGFSEEDRAENLRRVIHTANICASAGNVVLCSFVSPSKEERQKVMELSDYPFRMVYVKASPKTCAERDVKGMWAKAKAGEIKNFTGHDAEYTPPLIPNLTVDTEKESVEASTKRVLKLIGG